VTSEEQPLDNPDTLGAFRRGEEAALTLVYRAYVGDVANLLLRGFIIDRGKSGRVLGVEPEVQRELVQEVFLRAFKRSARDRYDPSLPYRPYLLRIAKNLMIDRLRKSGREVLAPGGEGPDINDLAERNEPVAPYDEGDVDGRRLQEATRVFLGGCPEELAAFVRARFQEGMSQADTAAHLNMTRRRVRTLEGHAREALRDHLKDQGLLGLLEQRVGADQTGPSG
jgi:RNA polymerase sigma factor (sigma-70 family)